MSASCAGEEWENESENKFEVEICGMRLKGNEPMSQYGRRG